MSDRKAVFFGNLRKLFVTTSAKQHFIYWILPLSVSIVFMACYFSKSELANEIISPKANREFGLLENLQNIVLLAMIIFSIKGIVSARKRWDKLAFLFLAIISTFALLEEIDYGVHYFSLLENNPEMETTGIHSIHNIPKVNGLIKFSFFSFFSLLFVLLPIFKERIRFIPQKFIPEIYFLFTVLTLLLVSRTAWHLNYTFKLSNNHSLDGNMAEFDELLIYYVLLIYIINLRKKINMEERNLTNSD